MKDYVILPHTEDNRLPPHTLIQDVKMTHESYGRSNQDTNGTLTHTVSSNDTPQPDGVL